MTTVEITVPGPLPTLRPVEGDPAAVTAYANDLLSTSSAFDDLDTFAMEKSRADGWSGDAATAYAAVSRSTAKDAGTLSLALRKVSLACDDYATALTGLQRRYDDLVERRGFIADQRQQLVVDIEAAKDVSDAEIAALRDRAAALGRSIDGLTQDHDTLHSDSAAADRSMTAAFTALDSLDKARRKTAGEPDIADDVMTRPGSPTSTDSSPEAVNAWWDSLTHAERQAVIAAYPDVIGNADGVPITARDEANRLQHENDLESWRLMDSRHELPYELKQPLENAEAAQDALENGADRVDPVTGEHLVPQLVIYDPQAFDGDGRIAVSLGNPDTADNVSVLVPGITTNGSSAASLTTDAFNIYEAARYADPTASMASMMWIGYDAPSDWDILTVGSEGRATEGGALLADTVDGLRASREGDPAHLTVIGHSYGSTTTGHAAYDHGLAADDIVFVGSPGVGGDVDHASDLGIDSDHVWAGNNSRDPVAALADDGWVGGHTLGGAGMGNDTAEDDFGANRFQAESTTRGDVRWFGDHSKYFDPNTESLYNISQVVTGDYGDVMSAEHTYDPWYDGVQDPEWDRDPTSPQTRPSS
jgi:pimeloyl-ACP methyl ester carboxylesterase